MILRLLVPGPIYIMDISGSITEIFFKNGCPLIRAFCVSFSKSVKNLKTKMLRGIVLIFCSSLVCSTQAQNVRLVHPLGSDDGNVCIDVPCATIARAIEVAVPGDIVDIAPGEYEEHLSIGKSLILRGAGQENITVIQPPGAPADVFGRVLTLSGNNVEIEISDLVIQHGNAFETSGNGGGILVENGASLVLSKVILRNNQADFGGGLAVQTTGNIRLDEVLIEDNIAWRGGGGLSNIVVLGGSLELNSVTFRRNRTVTSPDQQRVGGGMANLGPVGLNEMSGSSGNIRLNDVLFDQNSATFGGGMFTSNSAPVLNRVKFSINGASLGGGLHNEHGSPVLEEIEFIGNRASGRGGGMYSDGLGMPVLRDVTFIENLADRAGGGMANNTGSVPSLVNVAFLGNGASCLPGLVCVIGVTRTGGGMWNQGSNPELANVIFSGNYVSGGAEAGNFGGGIYNETGAPRLVNATFSGNRAVGDDVSEGGGMYSANDADPALAPVIRNTIFWNNRDGSGTGTAGASISSSPQSTFIAEFSLVQGMFPPGNGNLDGQAQANDPLFLSTPDPDSAPTTAGNLRLRPESPMIDAGNNDFIEGIETDLDGNPRVIEGIVDLGAYEFTGEVDDVLFRDRFEQ